MDAIVVMVTSLLSCFFVFLAFSGKRNCLSRISGAVVRLDPGQKSPRYFFDQDQLLFRVIDQS
ncbi:MAG: hypothetical protein WCF66_12010 [Pseudolabrys sp.]